MPPKKSKKASTKKEEEKVDSKTKEETDPVKDEGKEEKTEAEAETTNGDAMEEDDTGKTSKGKRKKAKEEEEDGGDDEDGEGDGGNYPKRRRKASNIASYEPEDFTQMHNSVLTIEGRGEKLKDIPGVKENIDKYILGSEEMTLAHRLLYSVRGKVAKKDMKKNILEFSGYLKKIPEGYDEKKLEEEDEEEETKYSIKAFKLSIPQIKKLCDFFLIDRTPDSSKALDKEGLIDRLLDFIGAPDPDLISSGTKSKGRKKKAKKQSPTKAKKPAKKSAKKAAAADEETEDEEDEKPFATLKDHEKGDMPDEKKLRQWVQAYVVCFDMDTATTKHAIKTASDKFGVDLSKQKGRIKEILAEEM